MSKTEPIIDSIFEDDDAILRFISLVESEMTTYKLGTDVDGLNLDAKFTKANTGNFILSFELDKESENFDLEYFFIKPAILMTYGVIILIQNKDVKGFSQSISNTPPHKCEVEIREFRGDIDDLLWNNSKQTAFFRYETSQFEPYKSGIIFNITTNKNQNHSYKNGVLLNIEDIPILLYFERIDADYGYLIFKTQGNIDFDKFEKIIASARAALGLISGYYLADSVYYISLKRPKGVKGLTYRYRNIQETISNDYPLLDYHKYTGISESELKINGDQFNELVKLLYKHEEYYRSSLLLINAGVTKGISKGSLASVALETISSIIVEKQSSKKIIDKNELVSKLKHELIKGLKTIKTAIPIEQYKIFENKINQINTIPNAKKLEDSFNILGIKLDEEELFCLSCRNKLLHGALPKNENLSMLSNDDIIFWVSNRLIMLSTILLLKKAGYKGKVIDWGFTEVAKRRAILMGERIKAGSAHREIEPTIQSDGEK